MDKLPDTTYLVHSIILSSRCLDLINSPTFTPCLITTQVSKPHKPSSSPISLGFFSSAHDRTMLPLGFKILQDSGVLHKYTLYGFPIVSFRKSITSISSLLDLGKSVPVSNRTAFKHSVGVRFPKCSKLLNGTCVLLVFSCHSTKSFRIVSKPSWSNSASHCFSSANAQHLLLKISIKIIKIEFSTCHISELKYS